LHGKTDDLRRTFVEAYPLYVAGLLTKRGIPVDPVIADAVVEGTAVLDALLRALGEMSLPEQRSSPLELFREALRPIDRALELTGVPVGSHGSGARSLAPWDRYGLAPGSSQVLGDAAHEAHMLWGIAKARAMASTLDITLGPAVGLFCSPRERPVLVAHAEAAGYRTVGLPSDDAVAMAFVSGDQAGADRVIRVAAANTRVVVYGRSIDDLDRVRYASLGVHTVLGTEQFLANVAKHLPPIV